MGDLIDRLKQYSDSDMRAAAVLVREATDLIEELEAENKGMREAIECLNAELDAYWKDPSQAGKRPPEAYIQNIVNAQISSLKALKGKAGE